MPKGLEGRTGRFETTRDSRTRGVLRDKHEVVFDEPEFLPVAEGEDTAPSPVDYLMAGLAGCQVSVLDQALKKARVADYHIEVEATIDAVGTDDVPEEMPSNTVNRIQHIAIDVTLTIPEEHRSRAQRCLDVYDDGCIVGQSLRAGIDYTPRATLETAEESHPTGSD